MSAFGSPLQPGKFDYRYSKLQVYDEEELEEGDVIVS
jgi:hypothetical protein